MTLENARELRKNATDCERLLWLHLRAQRLQGFKFKRQQPIGAYIVDFVCFETRCIVEADGGHHAEQIDYDTRRDDWLRSQGFSVLRFWNNDILANTEGVLETILSACLEYVDSPSPQPLPRQGGGAKAPDLLPKQTGTPSTPVPAWETVFATETDQHCSPLPLRERGRRTMSFPRYESYKDSGVEWLGEVPEHWKLKCVRHLLRPSYDGLKIGPFGSQLTSQMLRESGYKVYGQENVIANDFNRGERFISEEKYQELAVYELRPGDILITMMGTSGRCGIVPDNIEVGVMDSHLLRMRVTEEIRSQFLRLLIDESAYVAHQIRVLGKGSIMHGLNSSIIKELLLTIPAVDEQDLILSFLDRETAKIDVLIAEQQRLIELLKEKRQAVISHAVTKGLNPPSPSGRGAGGEGVPMKDSGIEWLGEVPAHWEILKGGQIGRIFGSEQITEEYVCDEGELPFIKVGSLSLNDFEIASWDWYVNPIIAHKCRPTNNYIVFPKRGAAIFTNKVNIVERPSLIDPNLMGWEMGERVIAKFIAYILKSRKIEELADVSTVPQINNKHIAPERFPVPSLKEQNEIIVYLDNETAKLDILTAEAQRGIALLKERRSALISAAVTGKIDVRGLADTLPESITA